MKQRVEGCGVQPRPIDRTTNAVALARVEQTAGGAIRAPPFSHRIYSRPLIGHAADFQQAGEQSEG